MRRHRSALVAVWVGACGSDIAGLPGADPWSRARMVAMVDDERQATVVLWLGAELVQRTHPYVTVQRRPRSAGFLVAWIGEPTVDEMRELVAAVIAERSIPLDPADVAYKREKLDLQALAAEAMRLHTRGLTKAAKDELREDLMQRLRQHKRDGGVAAVMSFMRTLREQARPH